MNIINRSSVDDLNNLLNKLNVKNYMVCRASELKKNMKNKKIKNYILNLDNKGGGTHWVYYSPFYNIYFDSYAQQPPTTIPKKNSKGVITKLASTIKEIESIEAQDCGQLCALFSYYINYKSKNDFYKLFKDVYI
jgi:hypothetical protein